MVDGSQWHNLKAADGTEIDYRRWGAQSPQAVLQVVHGAAEHSGRYQRFAEFLVDKGYAVYAADHRGHGRTRVRSGELGDAGPNAWNNLVEDEMQLTRLIRQENPGAKLILFGHSLGSFMAQDYITRQPELIDGVVLSGTSYGPPPSEELIATLDAAAARAPLGGSEFWTCAFAKYNRAFSSDPGFQWLSRDEAEVQKYLDDPLSGFAFTNELVRDYFQGMADVRDPVREEKIPSSLPVLVIQGALDPVGRNLEGTQALLDRYMELGLKNVAHHFYPGGRHEMLNEMNRDEVQDDVLAWLDACASTREEIGR